jgi:redox-sensitive bicupin YhaK (pirin superfamily)
MPEQEEGVMEGFQLWLNLPGKDKLCAPWYRDIQSGDIPEFTTDRDVTVRVISGESHGVLGAMHRPAREFPTNPLYLDVHFPDSGGDFFQALPAQHNAFVYVYRGEVSVVDSAGNTSAVPLHRMAILDNQGDGLHLRAAPGHTRALVLAAQPLNEPIAQYGPFVMNTRQELMTAVEDFQNGRMG